MTTNKTYIKSYCSVQNNTIILNNDTFIKSEPSSFSDFSKEVYKKIEINYPKFFKMDNLSKLAFLAAELLFKNEILGSEENNIALVFANKSSSLDTDVKYQNSIHNKANYFPSPAVFVYTLPNICIGEISIKHQLKSENTFFIFDRFNSEFMTNYCNVLLHTKKAEKVLCGWVEYYNEEYKAFLYLVELKGKTEHKSTVIETLFNK